MKKLLVIAIALTTVNAFASRARVNSLGNSPHLTDTQGIYSNPSDMFLFGDFVSLESGATAVSGTAKGADAEGLVVRSMGDAKMALSLGHRSENGSGYTNGLRQIISSAFASSNVLHQQNPIELSYGMKSGDMTWAGTLVYSNYNDKANKEKESTLGVRLGARTGAWDFYWKQGLSNTASRENQYEFKGKAGTSVFAGYTMDNLYAFGYAELVEGSVDDKAPVNTISVKSNTIKAGAVVSNKKDGNELFYGASLVKSEKKVEVSLTSSETKTSTLNLPLIIGMEVDAASWLALRGSLTQDVLLSDSKVETATSTTSETAPGANTTVASVGAGLKFNKVTVDGALSGLTTGSTGTSQALDGNNLLTQVGITYMF